MRIHRFVSLTALGAFAVLANPLFADTRSQNLERAEHEVEERAGKLEQKQRKVKNEARAESKNVRKQKARSDSDESEGLGEQAESGSQKSQEMRARQAESKAIKDDYKTSGEKVKGKKPWWKFWAEDAS